MKYSQPAIAIIARLRNPTSNIRSRSLANGDTVCVSCSMSVLALSGLKHIKLNSAIS